MQKTKSTRHALCTSGLALLACVSMFVGSTFAWFTDSVVSTGNKIQSGTLGIDLSLLDKNGEWNSVKEDKNPIFNYGLWEPGYTNVKILKIENKGNLALKWVAQFVANEEFSILADVIDVYVKLSATEFTYPSGRNLDGYSKLGNVVDFVNAIENNLYGSLQEDEAAYVGIALKMQESADNQYQGLPLGDFDIKILATQYASESDSFGNDYDSAATFAKQFYYPSLSAMMDVANNGTVSDAPGNLVSDPVVAVKLTSDGYHATLLKSIEEKESISVTAPVTLDLDGHTISFQNTSTGFVVSQESTGFRASQEANATFSIDAQDEGSAIAISGADAATMIKITSGICEIKGGTYQATSENAGNKNNPNPCIMVTGSGRLNVSHATVVAADSNKGTSNAIYIADGCHATITNCDITATAPYGLNVSAVYCAGSADVSASSMKGYSNYTANAAGTDYASHSRGVVNDGEMTFTDCYVIGTHSGISNNGSIRIDGGTYESYGHGGIYFSGSNTTSYVKNATIQWSKMPDGYYDDGIAGTNKAGMYIGGGSTKRNIVVYADNCVFDAPSQSIVVRGTSGEKNNILYISNSVINTKAKIRIDANNKLCIGSGNNFDSIHTKSRTSKKGTIETTNMDYREVIDAAD